MKKIQILGMTALFLLTFATTAVAAPSISLDLINGGMKVNNTEGRHYDPSNDGYRINIELPYQRVFFGLEYVSLSIPDDYDENSGFTLYAADQRIFDLRVGYRWIDEESFKFDTNLVRDRFKYNVATENTYEHTIKSTCFELRGEMFFSERFSTEITAGFSLSSNAEDSNDNVITDSDVKYFGLKFNTTLNEHWTVVLGYRIYENSFTRDATTRTYKQNGLTLGMEYNF